MNGALYTLGYGLRVQLHQRQLINWYLDDKVTKIKRQLLISISIDTKIIRNKKAICVTYTSVHSLSNNPFLVLLHNNRLLHERVHHLWENDDESGQKLFVVFLTQNHCENINKIFSNWYYTGKLMPLINKIDTICHWRFFHINLGILLVTSSPM